ncbi:MAG: DUF739 family protein [Dialister sp.]|nr:DUF739 family protein [Dialister sp.]MDU5889670.1 DUF739 family protein [Dialister sp.]
MLYDYRKLRGLIKTQYQSESEFAKNVGINRSTLSLKLSNERDFTKSDIQKICNQLSIPLNEVGLYFFTPLVEK